MTLSFGILFTPKGNREVRSWKNALGGIGSNRSQDAFGIAVRRREMAGDVRRQVGGKPAVALSHDEERVVIRA